MKLNGKNIIFDDDITMTGTNSGEKLSEVIEGLQTDSTKMKSYLKWIYNYGGVGGSGGGNGGGGSTEYILFATLNEIQIKEGQNISLGGEGNYPLKIQIQRPGGSNFTAKYKIKLEGSSDVLFESENIILNLGNSYTYEKSIPLNTNAIIIVEVTDSLYNITKQVSSNFVTKSYLFVSNLVNNKGNKLPQELTVDEVKDEGLNVKLNYEIAIPYKSLDYYFELNLQDRTIKIDKFNNSDLYVPLKNPSGELVIDILDISKRVADWSPSPENAGFYSYKLSIELSIENQFIDPIDFNGNYNLIPKSLYLLVSPTSGNIYTKEVTEEDNPFRYEAGYVSFIAKPYFGGEKNSQCTIKFYLDIEGEERRINTVQSNLRTPEYVEVYSVKEGLNCIKFNLECGGIHYPAKDQYVSYYFWIELDENSVNWYNYSESIDPNRNKRFGRFNYYRGGWDRGENNLGHGEWSNRNLKRFQTLVNGKTYRQSVNKNSIPIDLIGGGDTWRLIDYNNPEELKLKELEFPGDKVEGEETHYTYSTAIHLGLQYSEINTSDSVIFTGYKRNTVNGESIPWLKVYQNKVVIDNTNIINYYFPKTKDNFGKKTEYHLLSIVFRYMNEVMMNKVYEVLVYVDGIIEGALSSYIEEDPLIEGILIGRSNMWIDLLELSFPEYLHKEGDDNKESIPEDVSIFQYYLRYRSERKEDTEEEDKKYAFFKSILGYSKNMTVNNNGEVTSDLANVSSIAKNLSVPTLIMDIQDDTGDVKRYLDADYGENQGESEFNVKLKWSRAYGDMEPIDIPFDNGFFKISIQGSSTKRYKCKNYTLTIENGSTSENSPIYLFSPNYNEDDDSTFLPEQRFTLKADVVDSSHSNNTSVGRFVNDITNKFKTIRDDQGIGNAKLQSHIKNCLDGFPFVLFLNFVKKDGTNTCYYQGVYNFNLGRESHFNLGYSDYMVFCDPVTSTSNLQSVTKGFLFYSVPKSSISLKSGLLVAEVQGNSAFFDFSQYDPTILFYQNIVGDKLYMFGDIVTGSNMTLNQAKTIISNTVYKISRAGGYLFGDNLMRKTFVEETGGTYGYGYDEGYHATIKKDTGQKDKQGKPIYQKFPANQVPNYRKQFSKIVTSTGEVLPTPKKGLENLAEYNDVVDLIITDESKGDGIESKPWIDFVSLSEYYTICMAFGLVDSVQKNMNIKTWNADTSKGKATFYAAFYDMDTCLGVNNEGKDVSYFAFSDYWDYTEDKSSGSTIKPSPVTIYRDYSPTTGESDKNTGDFYDTASSYLFAVAKYARKLFNGDNDTLPEDRREVEKWPKELWKNWRMGTKSELDKTKGCLSSAEEFMKNYFTNNLGSVCPVLVSMNYRNKYLVKKDSDTGDYVNNFDTINFEKFNGTRIYKATDWLSSRFHILDAYFNITNSISNYQFYNEKQEYVSITGLQEPSVIDSESLALNPDVAIYQDIFAGSSVNQGSGKLDITVRAHEYSPLFITTPTSSRRFLLGGDKSYNIVTTLSGTQIYKYGGSSAWTDLDSINSFNFDTLFIKSKYLETLSATNNNRMSVNEKNINLPSLKNLILTGPNFYGTFGNIESLSGGHEIKDKYTNLNFVDVSNSSISLNLKNSSCQEIYIPKMRNASVSIIDCNEIKTLFWGVGSFNNPGTTLDLLDIRPIPSFLSYNGVHLEFNKINRINLINNRSTKNREHPEGRSIFELKNDETTTSVNLSGFAEVYIENCPNLNELTITDPDQENEGDKLFTLTLLKCGTSSIKGLRIGKKSTKESEVDLRDFNELTNITIKDCSTITRIMFREDINKSIFLEKGSLSGNRKLKYISGEGLVINGPNVFNWTSYTLQKGPESEFEGNLEKRQTKFTINTDDISGLFNVSSVKREAAQYFLRKANTPGIDKVKNISYLFANSPISYNEIMLIEDLGQGSTNYLDFEDLVNVTNAAGVFSWSGVTALHPKMLNFGKNSASINADSFTQFDPRPNLSSNNEKDHLYTYLSVPVDVFKYIINKLTGRIGWSIGENYGVDYVCKFKVVEPIRGVAPNPAGKTDEEKGIKVIGKDSPFLVRNLFHPGGKNPSQITSICSVGFHEDMKLNLQNLFGTATKTVEPNTGKITIKRNPTWNKLSYIENFLFDRDYQNVSNLDMLLQCCNSLYSTKNCFRINNKYYPIDLNLFCNWDTFLNNSASHKVEPFQNTTNSDSRVKMGSFCLYKYITKQNFNPLLRMFRENLCVGMSNVFRNCSVIFTGGENNIEIGKQINTTVKRFVGTFYNFRMVYSGEPDLSDEALKNLAIHGESSYFSISPNFFRSLKAAEVMPYMFYGTKLTVPTNPKDPEVRAPVFPLDFFGKREIDEGRSCYYVDPNVLETLPLDEDNDLTYQIGDKITQPTIKEAFKKAILYNYRYSHNISDMRSMFENVRWEKEEDTVSRKNARSFVFEPDKEGVYDYLPLNFILLKDTNEKIYDVGTVYYNVSSKVVSVEEIDPEKDTPIYKDYDAYFYRKEGTLKYNPEVEDLKIITESKEALGSYRQSIASEDQEHTFINYLIDSEATRRFFIVPDFLYGCKGTCNITGLFSNSENYEETLEGMIPDHFLKYCKSTSIRNVFKNLNIVPKYRATETYSLGESKKATRIYSFIPSEFTTTENLSESFNFHFFIPDKEYYSDGIEWTDAFYILLKDSIGRSTRSLSNAFPSVFNSELIKKNIKDTFPDSHLVDYKIHFNIMHAIEEQGNGVDGLDLGYFRNLALDNLVSPIMSFFLHGDLFNPSFYLNDARWDNPNNFIINSYPIGLQSNTNHDSIISMKCNLPKVQNKRLVLNNRNIIKFGISLKIYKSQIIGNIKDPYGDIQSGNHRVQLI